MLETLVYQSPPVVSHWWVDIISSRHPSFVPAWALVPFPLGILLGCLHRPKRSSFQWLGAPQILCQMWHACIYQSGMIVRKLQIMWGIEIFAGTRHPVTKGPLPKVVQRCSNSANMFPWIFEMQPLAHFGMLCPQYQNNFRNYGSGRAEDGPRGLVGQRKIFIEKNHKLESVLQNHAGLLPK